MLRLVARRARAQWPLLAALLSVLVIGATLLGTCALLLDHTSQRSVEVSAMRADPDEVTSTAYVAEVSADNARSVAAGTRDVLVSAAASFPVTTSARASSYLRELPMADGRGGSDIVGGAYMSALDDLPARATLVSGRWPRATGQQREAAVLQSTARLLGLRVGSRVSLGLEFGRTSNPPVELTVVAIVRPTPDAGWERDPYGGTGFSDNPPESTSARQIHAYGPFLVDYDSLLNGGSAISRLEVTARPELSNPTVGELDRLTAALLMADRRLAGTLGERAKVHRVDSPLPQLLLDLRNQRQLTTGTVLAVALIGLLLTTVALALAGRLTTGLRDAESELLAALGTSRSQFSAVAATEAALIATMAVVLAVPLSSLLYAGLTRVDPLSSAGLTAPVTVSGVQIAVVVAGVVALAALHIALAGRRDGVRNHRGHRELLARSGADLLLAGLAAVGWWQLRSQPAGAGSSVDAVRVLAPALILVAGAALALRVVPPLLRRAERLAARSPGFVLTLATAGAARRPRALAAGLLICLGGATATFGTAFDATWRTSQRDQADLSVGTDLALSLTAAPVIGQSRQVEQATGGTVSPAVTGPVVVGQWLGGPGGVPRVVAVDTRRAGALLRGRHDDSPDWGTVTRDLAPTGAVGGVALPRDSNPVLTGSAGEGQPTLVVVRLLLEDLTGLRTTCASNPVVLDNRPHPVTGCTPADGLRLIGVGLAVLGDVRADVERQSRIDATLNLPGPSASPWFVRAGAQSSDVAGPTVTVDGTRLRLTATVGFSDPSPESRVLVATAFDDPGPMPVILSRRLATEIEARPGSEVTIALDQTPVDATVAAVVAEVPSAPGAPALLADLDWLTRSLAVQGNADSPVTAWWIGEPERPDAVARAAELNLGPVTSRAAETDRLIGSPMRAPFPAVLRVLVVAAVVMLFGGVLLQVTADMQLRAVEVARLRGLGIPRRGIRDVLFTEYAAVLVPLLAAGTLVGALASRLIAPLLVRSDTGTAASPPVVADWPWLAEAALLVGLFAVCAVALGATIAVQSRRADAAHLRVAS